MLSYASQSSSKFHSFFNKENTSVKTETKLNFISSIWDHHHILRLEEKNRKCLWRTKVLLGINADKDLPHILGKKGTHIKCCYVPAKNLI